LPDAALGVHNRVPSADELERLGSIKVDFNPRLEITPSTKAREHRVFTVCGDILSD
jgi:hypothetical protein